LPSILSFLASRIYHHFNGGQCRLGQDALREIRDGLNQCRVLGSERFKDEIERALQRRVRPGKAGRPKKRVDVVEAGKQ